MEGENAGNTVYRIRGKFVTPEGKRKQGTNVMQKLKNI